MKRGILTGMLSLGLATAGWAADGKTAVADVNRLVKLHPDARAAEVELKRQRDEFEAEQKQWVEDLEKLKGEFDKLREETLNKALTEEARDRKKKELEEKVGKIREFDQKAREQIGLRQKQIAEQTKRIRESIMGKLEKVIKEYAEKKGLELVLNSSGTGTGFEFVLYSGAKLDITEELAKLISVDASGKEEKEGKPKQGL